MPGGTSPSSDVDDLDGVDAHARLVDRVAHARDRELLDGPRSGSGGQSHEATFRDQGDDVECEAGDVRVVREGAATACRCAATVTHVATGAPCRPLHVAVAARAVACACTDRRRDSSTRDSVRLAPSHGAVASAALEEHGGSDRLGLRRAVPAPERDQRRVGRARVLAGEKRRLDVGDVGRAGDYRLRLELRRARAPRRARRARAPTSGGPGDERERGAEDGGESEQPCVLGGGLTALPSRRCSAA